MSEKQEPSKSTQPTHSTQMINNNAYSTYSYSQAAQQQVDYSQYYSQWSTYLGTGKTPSFAAIVKDTIPPPVKGKLSKKAAIPPPTSLAPIKHSKKKKKKDAPSYISVDSKSRTDQDDWPESLRNFVQKVYKQVPAMYKDEAERNLKQIITNATESKSLWTIDWDTYPVNTLYQTSLGKRKLDSVLVNQKPCSSKEFDIPEDDSDLALLPAPQRAAELARRAQRRERFKEASKQQENLKRLKELEIAKTRASFLAAGAQGNPDVIDWDKDTIIGTCQKLEKSYLRLTSAPDPSTVRPLHILKQTLELLKRKWKKEQNYTYICDQFKSLRQDLTVQRIKNEFTVQVYETHARIALEKGDLGEYNQCQAQLKQLYYRYQLPGRVDEFAAYRILYMLHTLNNRDLIKELETISDEKGEAVEHALAVRSALAIGNYPMLFKLYHDAPNLSGYLMDQFIERERIKTVCKLLRAYRPTLDLDSLAKMCGFIPMDISPVQQVKCKKDARKWFESFGLIFSNEKIDCKVAYPLAKQKENEIETKGVDIKGQIH